MTNLEYRSAAGISRSELFKIRKSPLHFRYAMDHPEEPTAALLFGQAAHKYILEKDDFENEFAVAPFCDRRTREGKTQYGLFLEMAAGKTIISESDFEIIKMMDQQIQKNDLAHLLLTGEHETSFFWVDDQTGEKCKCRTDCITEHEGIKYIVDYKTTDSCEDGAFERSARKYGYKFQAGMYREGVFQNRFEEYGFVFVAQEKSAPYAVRVYFCSPEFIEQGYDQFREYIGIYHECKMNEKWYGYDGLFNVPVELLGDDY